MQPTWLQGQSTGNRGSLMISEAVMCGVRSIGLFLVMSAGFASVGCEAARAPAAPSEAAELSSPAV